MTQVRISIDKTAPSLPKKRQNKQQLLRSDDTESYISVDVSTKLIQL